jgi:hypothetical protein
VFRQLSKKEVKQIADIMLRDVFKRAEEKGLKIEVTEKFKDRWAGRLQQPSQGPHRAAPGRGGQEQERHGLLQSGAHKCVALSVRRVRGPGGGGG